MYSKHPSRSKPFDGTGLFISLTCILDGAPQCIDPEMTATHVDCGWNIIPRNGPSLIRPQTMKTGAHSWRIPHRLTTESSPSCADDTSFGAQKHVLRLTALRAVWHISSRDRVKSGATAASPTATLATSSTSAPLHIYPQLRNSDSLHRAVDAERRSTRD